MKNKRYLKISYEIKKAFSLTLSEYALLDLIYFYSTNPNSSVAGWCYASKEHLATMIDMSRRSVTKLISSLAEKELVIKSDDGRHLKTTPKWNGTYFSQWEESSQSEGNKFPRNREESSQKSEKKVPTSNTIRKDSGVKTDKKEIVYPYLSVNFMNAWTRWKEYKSQEYGFKFKSPISEQAGLNKLARMGKDEEHCIALIMNAIECTWKGIYPIKETKNGKGSTAIKNGNDLFSGQAARDTMAILDDWDREEKEF